MKNKVPRICLFIQSLCKVFLMVAIATMDETDSLAAIVAINCLSDVISLYWIVDGLSN